MKTTQKALSILLAMLLVFSCIPTVWAAEMSSQLESAVESSMESTPPEEDISSSEPEITPEPSATPEPSEEPAPAPAPVPDPYVEYFEVMDAEFGGQYVMVAPEAVDVTVSFGREHQALDMAAPEGSPVLAADEGTVTTVQVWDGSKSTDDNQSYGHMVQIQHPDGNSTLYAHLSEINVRQGQTVQRGQQIGRVGSTGNATGAHLHFEVLTPSGKVDPYPYLTGIELYARDSISSVKADLEGGSRYLTDYGVTRDAIVNELSAHEHDNYYLGTTYAGGDVQSPNGDTSYNGTAGMNCGGFVGYVLRKVGLNCSAAIDLIKSTGDDLWFGSGKPYDLLAGASNYYQLAKAAGLTCYVYNTKAEMLADGKLEKGDIILMYWSLQPFNDGADNHIGFYWGESSGDDILWHSSTEPGSGNQISAITPKAANCIYIVIKIEPSDYNVTLTKTSADAECVAGNNNYSLAGATYNVYKGTSASGTVVATFTTDANGHAELSKPLGNGTYSVKETKAPMGYALDSKVYTFTINGADTSLDVQDDPSRIQLTVQKRSAGSGNAVPDGDASLAGAVYEVTYTKNGQTITERGTTNASGIVRFSHIPLGTVTVQEITPPPGYKLDPTVHTYTVTGDKTTTAVYELTPTDITDEVYKGRISLQKMAEMLNAADVPETGAVFEVYLKSAGSYAAAKAAERDLLTSGTDGKATTKLLPYGTYIVHQRSGGKGREHIDDFEVQITEDGETYSYSKTNPMKYGQFKIVKTSEDGIVEGLQFRVTRLADGYSQIYTTDSNGTILTEKLPIYEDIAGTKLFEYTIEEVETPIRYVIPESQTVTLTEGSTAQVSFHNILKKFTLSVDKDDREIGGPQGNGTLAGAWYGVFLDGELVDRYQTDAEGKFTTKEYICGYNWELREIDPSEGYLLDEEPHHIPAEPDNFTEEHNPIDMAVTEQVKRGGIAIEKRDLESGLLTPLGGASLDGTEFAITNLSTNPVKVGEGEFAPGEVALTLIIKDGAAQSEPNALPFGSYSIQEVKVGEGYLLTDGEPRKFDITEEGQLVEYKEGDAWYNQVKRGDLEFVKVAEDDMHRLAGVPFKLTSQTTGESHILVTDKNGQVSTANGWNAHSEKTNYNDTAEPGTYDDLAGVWFGLTTEGTMVDVDDELGALPYDSYTLDELRCPANENYALVHIEDIAIMRNMVTINLGTIDDAYEEQPAISTTAAGTDGGKLVSAEQAAAIIDSVSYSGLTPGKKFTLKGWLMDKPTGEKLLVDGKEVTAEKEFTPKESGGVEDMTFTFDARQLGGHDVVVFEELYLDSQLVTGHANIEDIGQTVTIEEPQLKTTATINGEKEVDWQGEVTLTDTVLYTGLTPGKTYQVKGVLMDKSTDEKLLVDGKEVTAEAEFTPERADGSVDITFTFDITGLKGKSIVAFETLYKDGVELAVHADINDEDQTVKIIGPEIGTTATVDGKKEVDPLGEVTLTDEVAYMGLTVGKAYTVKGVLMDKATGEPLLIDDKQITAETQFAAEEPEGTVEVLFSFDASALRGKDVVVFETLYREEVEVASHTDINDEGQTVQVHDPEIGTTATVDGEKQAEPMDEITLIDEVAYSGLTPGKTYQIKGVLMDKSTGEKLLVDDKEINTTTEFVPDESSGTVQVPFKFDASGLQGKSIVVFETLYYRDIELAVHADIEDEAQTVSFGAPELKTTATIGGKKEAAPSRDIVLEDVVSYTGLTPGKEYTVKGILMDKATGEKFLVGDKEVTAEAAFIPETADGEVTVTFHFDGSAITRKTELVVFETLYMGDKEICAHADLEDKDQTVTIVPPSDTPDVPKTGDDRSVLLPLITLGAAIAGLAVLGLVRRKRRGIPHADFEDEIDSE